MNTINKTKRIQNIVSGLGILAILALAVMPVPASAQGGDGYYTPYGDTSSSYQGANNYNSNSYNSAPAPVDYYATPIIYSNNPTTANTASSASSVKSTTNKSSVVKKTTTATATNTNQGSNLAAGVIFGSNSFMPSGLIQWIFFAILILLFVILARIIFGANKNYHSTPLKHN